MGPKPKKTVEETYQKHEQKEHILLRPDTYIGSTVITQEQPMWLLNHETELMEKRNPKFNPGLYKIADEIIVNAIDQSTLDPLLNQIKISINKEEGYISVFNSGKGVPVVIHGKHNIYVPELIFANLLSSSNYDDTEQRKTGGRNGYGAKLAVIFSTKVEIETVDIENHKKYKQTFENNMNKINPPEIKSNSSKTGYFKFTFWPDFKRFGIDGFSDDFVSIIEKRAYDACACTPESVKVFFNEQELKYKSFKKYIELFLGKEKGGTARSYESPNEDWEVCVAPSPEYNQVSFVNGISTTKGGSHVDVINAQVARKVIECVKSKKKYKGVELENSYIKNHMFIFIKCSIVNPTFSSQTKEECNSRANTFNSRCDLSSEFYEKILKTSILDEAVALAKYKESRLLNKTDGKKKNIVKGLSKLDDANKAGTVQSGKCSLYLTEGDSAKALIMAGFSVVGRDYYGAYPLRGKVLNVRESNPKQLAANKEITELKQILGLEQGKKYKSTDELRYGKVVICTDADHDGFHIRGLIINFLQWGWPTLMGLDKFVTSFVTPIVKVSKSRQLIPFYNMEDYNEWKEENNQGKGWAIKYYKGLGTSTSKEGKEYFNDLTNHILSYQQDENTEDSITLAFKRDRANDRKAWLSSPIEVLDPKKRQVSYTEFIHKELKQFSWADNVRSIPSMVDGFKPSQRKVLWVFLNSNQTKEVKVSQIAGKISEKSAYHHGEVSLFETIIKMAQTFIGSNNINLLKPAGQFGTRLKGGKDSSAARYIFTCLSKTTTNIFKEEDDPILEYNYDDGAKIEPKYFVPTIPMILVNGSLGVGTGYSTDIPCFNPSDIVKNVKRVMKGKPQVPMVPWYNKFTGTITKVEENKFESKGVCEIDQRNPKRVVITELPIGKWSDDYREFLEGLRDDKNSWIDSMSNHNTDETVRIEIMFKDGYMQKVDIYKYLRLTSTINTTNMVLWDENGKIRKYNSPEEIISEFCNVRKEYYEKRRVYLIGEYTRLLSKTREKIRFMELVMDDKLRVFKMSKAKILEQIVEYNFLPLDGETYQGYGHLVNIPLVNFSEEKIHELRSVEQSHKTELDRLTQATALDLWNDDLQ